MMWKKITIGVVLILVLAMSVGAFVDLDEAGNSATGELVLEIKNQRTGETHELLLTIPRAISIADRVGQMFEKALSSQSISTDLYSDDPISIRAAVYAEWTTSDVKSVDTLETEQHGTTSDGYALYSSAEGSDTFTISTTEDYGLDDSDTHTPTNYFDQWKTIDPEGGYEYNDLLVEDVDGGQMNAGIDLIYTEEGSGEQGTAETSVTVDIMVESNTYDATVNLNADITDVDYK